ncbi:MAG: hypothetical protein KGH83_07215, partial [Thaumarchaeota archaeon]|nr:hypothetical protein [Nitrososphaerota archaeon]
FYKAEILLNARRLYYNNQFFITYYLTPTQRGLLTGCLVGVFSSLIGNYYITIDFNSIILQLLPRIIFSSIGTISTISTILFVFELKKFPHSFRNGLVGFGIPFSTVDFVFLLNNVTAIHMQ